MRSALVLAIVALVAVPLDTSSQEAAGDSAVTPPDSATIAQLQSELDWRNKIRVLTPAGYFELFNPSVTEQGIGYGTLNILRAPDLDASAVLQPLPFGHVLEIEVRKGRVGLGVAIGASVGFAFGVLVGAAFSCFDGGTDCSIQPSDMVLAGLVFGAIGGLGGVFLGEALYRWEPIYPVVDQPAATQ